MDRRDWFRLVLASLAAASCRALGIVSPATAKRTSTRVTVTSGPWKGVRDTPDPFDDPGYLFRAINGYIPDPDGASGFYGRTAFDLLNSGSAIYGTGRGQLVDHHVASDGTVYNFLCFGGKLFRVNTALTVFTDVTPVGVTIDSATTTRVKMVSQSDNLVVNDGVNQPWLATNLGSTPITATKIQQNAASDPWFAKDVTVWQGSIVFANITVGGVARPFDMTYSEPGLPLVGYQQTGSANWMTPPGGTDALTAVAGTNLALFYFRRAAIGRIVGSIATLATTNTTDSVAFGIGTRSAASVQLFSNTLFFTDETGRPWSVGVSDSAPTPLWHQFRGLVDSLATKMGSETLTSQVTVSGFEPTRNLYLVGTWSPTPAASVPPYYFFALDATTGRYQGTWMINGGIDLHAAGTLINSDGRAVLVVLGSLAVDHTTPQPSGFAWALKSVNDANPILENGSRVAVTIETGRLAFSADARFVADTATVLGDTGSNAAIEWISSGSTSAINSVARVGNPGTQGINRYVAGISAQGKGVQIAAVSDSASDPTLDAGVYSFQQVAVAGRMVRSGTDEG